jgi:CBS domain-containing protein
LTDIKISPTPSVAPETTLRDVGRLFAEQALRAIPVFEEGARLAASLL